MPRTIRSLFFALAISLLCSASAQVLGATTITLGFVSFDVDNPVNGQNSFSLNNFSGQTLGCNVDFQICANVQIATASLAIGYNDSQGATHTLTRTLASPVGPGTFTPNNFIFDSALYSITSAELTGTVAPTSFLLNDGSTVAVNPGFDAFVDLAVSGVGLIQLTGANTAASPEPGSFLSAFATLAVAAGIRRIRRT